MSKINIDQTTKTATGVTYFLSTDTDMLNPMTATARNVILSAGPYHSPKLLQLSGIGPADVLTPVGIPINQVQCENRVLLSRQLCRAAVKAVLNANPVSNWFGSATISKDPLRSLDANVASQ